MSAQQEKYYKCITWGSDAILAMREGFPEEVTFFKKLKTLFILAVLGLHCFAQHFSSFSEKGFLSSCDARASHRGGFSCCRAGLWGAWASVFAALGLRSTGSAVVVHVLSSPVARGIFLDQGSNPCPLHRQVDS